MKPTLIKPLRGKPQLDDVEQPGNASGGDEAAKQSPSAVTPFVWTEARRTPHSDKYEETGHPQGHIRRRFQPKTPVNVSDEFIPNHGLSDLDAREKQLAVDLRQCTHADLTKRYPAEWNCYRGMRGRERTKGAIIADDFKTFRGFLKKLGPCPAPGYTVDRTDFLDPEYAPDKVRWASKTAQANNRTTTIMLAGLDGKVRPATQQAALTGQKSDTIRKRLKRGWSEAEALAGTRSRVADTTRSAVPVNAYGLTALGWPVRVKDFEREWEQLWKAWCAQRHRGGLSRLAFFCWLARNVQNARLLRLEHRFPDAVGENADPVAPPPKVTADPEYRRWDESGRVLDSVWRSLGREQQDRTTKLFRQYKVRTFEQMYDLIEEINALSRDARRWS